MSDGQTGEPQHGGADSAAANADVQSVMDNIRLTVEQKRRDGFYRDVQPPFEPRYFPLGSAASGTRATLDVLHAAARLNIDGEPIRSHRPVTGFFIKTVKKITRYWTRKYTDPLFLQQSYFNAQLLQALAALQDEVDVLKQRLGDTQDTTDRPSQSR